jgi:hypothetical protein
MKRTLIYILVIALVSGIASYFMPWYAIAIVPFITTFLLCLRYGRGFLSGFLGIALLWTVMVLYADIRNEHILSARMAQLFGVPNILFILINIILGALVGGIAGWAGAVSRGAVSCRRY